MNTEIILSFVMAVFAGCIGGLILGIQMATWGVNFTREQLMLKIASALKSAPYDPRAKQNGSTPNLSSTDHAKHNDHAP